jgi:histidyl-tRNA synthetase
MKAAGKSGARYVFLLGEDEVASATVTLRNMESKEQQTLPRKDAVRLLREILST